MVWLLPSATSLTLLTFLSYLVSWTLADVPVSAPGNITLITGWYPHPGYNPKYPDEEFYRAFVTEHLARIHTPIIIYTPSSENNFLRASRPAGAPMILNNTFESVWDVPHLKPLLKSFHTDQLKMGSKDPRNGPTNTPHQFGIWNAKVFFLNEGAKANPFGTEYFFWHDAAGSVPKYGSLVSWPDRTRISEAFSSHGGHPDKILMVARELQPVFPVDASRELPPLTRTITALFFGGTQKSIEWLSKEYYELLHYYESLDQFVGIEELLLTAIGLIYPKRIIVVPTYRCYDPTQKSLSHMYYYFLYLAGRETGLVKGPISPPLFADIPKANMFSYTTWGMPLSVLKSIRKKKDPEFK